MPTILEGSIPLGADVALGEAYRALHGLNSDVRESASEEPRLGPKDAELEALRAEVRALRSTSPWSMVPPPGEERAEEPKVPKPKSAPHLMYSSLACWNLSISLSESPSHNRMRPRLAAADIIPCSLFL